MVPRLNSLLSHTQLVGEYTASIHPPRGTCSEMKEDLNRLFEEIVVPKLNSLLYHTHMVGEYTASKHPEMKEDLNRLFKENVVPQAKFPTIPHTSGC